MFCTFIDFITEFLFGFGRLVRVKSPRLKGFAG